MVSTMVAGCLFRYTREPKEPVFDRQKTYAGQGRVGLGWEGWMAVGWEELALCLFHYFSAFELSLCVWSEVSKLTINDKQTTCPA